MISIDFKICICAVLVSLISEVSSATNSASTPVRLTIQSVSDATFNMCVKGVKVKSHHLKQDDLEKKINGTGYIISSVIDREGRAETCTADTSDKELKSHGIISAEDFCMDGQIFLYLEVYQRTRVSNPKVILPKSKTCST